MEKGILYFEHRLHAKDACLKGALNGGWSACSQFIRRKYAQQQQRLSTPGKV